MALVGALLLAGCTGSDHGDAVPEDYTVWMNQTTAQMNRVSADDEGGAGGRLTAEDGSKKARAWVSLKYDLAGPYDVLAACRSSRIVHLVVRDLSAERDGAGVDDDTQSVLGTADMTCGVMSRIQIDVPKGRAGIAFEAATADRSGTALFNAIVVPRGSGQ